jgi:hypothetical protein
MRWIYTLPVIDRHLHEWFNGLTLDVKSRVEKLKAEGKL